MINNSSNRETASRTLLVNARKRIGTMVKRK
jgi:hypothetical protein